MFDFINEIPEDTLTKMIKYYKIPITPDNYISKEIIRVFKPYLSTIRVTLFNQYKHLNIEDPIVFQAPNNTSPDQSFITKQKNTPKFGHLKITFNHLLDFENGPMTQK